MDDLNAPLGLENRHKARSRVPALAFASAMLVAIGFASAWLYFSDIPDAIETQVATNPKNKNVETESRESNPDLRVNSQPQPKTMTDSGAGKPARLDEPQPDGSLGEPGIVYINPVAPGPIKLGYLPENTLLEKSAFGRIPKISKSGKTPLEAYARPVLGQGVARIAIVVGGLGLSQTGSKNAIEQLPGQITLAFAPYGNSLGRWMKKARKGGHELLMQVPMEPIGYPEVNPGRYTLITGATARENLESLYWSMARMTNYVGIMNYLGAKLQSDDAALGPVLDEINRRGLLYLDDGSTFSSKSAKVAKASGIPYARGNIVLDDDRSAQAIHNNLLALEKLARRNGKAVGVASAFPRSVAVIARWVEQAEKRGIDIVPISALVN